MELLDHLRDTPVASLLFALTLISSLMAFQRPELMRSWMLHPYSLVRSKRYGTIFSSGFIHGDWAHLLFNMITFYYFAFDLESVMVDYGGEIGHLLFALVYLLSMGLADISTIVKHRDEPSYFSLGASGAISGILFSAILFFPTGAIRLFFIPIDIPNPIFAVLYVIFSIYASRNRHDNINHEAHLWGGVAGFVLTIFFFPDAAKVFWEYLMSFVR